MDGNESRRLRLYLTVRKSVLSQVLSRLIIFPSGRFLRCRKMSLCRRYSHTLGLLKTFFCVFIFAIFSQSRSSVRRFVRVLYLKRRVFFFTLLGTKRGHTHFFFPFIPFFFDLPTLRRFTLRDDQLVHETQKRSSQIPHFLTLLRHTVVSVKSRLKSVSSSRIWSIVVVRSTLPSEPRRLQTH